ncbi:Pancreatic lipase-related protein 2 [Eumeta japonica]|uniref:Pancreatic lipase-related protein 2 n=1 Tax=Eumeta variegata TaxID=151549 RepID=A0A4C1Y1J1_EUMVA|nr:Pancreatic lipase-related protein 2 [Eumeta japonica]
MLSRCDPHTLFNQRWTQAVKGEYNVVALDGSSLIRWLYLRSTTYVRFMGEKLGLVLAAMTKSAYPLNSNYKFKINLLDSGSTNERSAADTNGLWYEPTTGNNRSYQLVNNTLLIQTTQSLTDGVRPEDLLLVGHSLGSHISSFAGKTYYNVTGKKVGRISGLDPAGPCFSHIDPELRLRASDAQFVDVMHTDAGVYGLEDAVGHVDFYPNSGSQQPNCLFQTCSHSRAWLYYSESVVNPEAFPAVRCDSWDDFKNEKCGDEIKYMGYPVTSDTRGKFYLQSGEDSPYGLGESGLKYQGERGIVKNILFGGQDATKSVIAILVADMRLLKSAHRLECSTGVLQNSPPDAEWTAAARDRADVRRRHARDTPALILTLLQLYPFKQEKWRMRILKKNRKNLQMYT